MVKGPIVVVKLISRAIYSLLEVMNSQYSAKKTTSNLKWRLEL